MSLETRGVLHVEDTDGHRVLTFDRPEVLNAFDQDLWLAIRGALVDAADDDGLRCVVLTGAGRAFTSGVDLGDLENPERFGDEEPGYNQLMPVVETFPKPLLAAVNGVAVGIGATILPHCDIAYVSSEARLKMPFISLGVTTEASASYLLPATVGWQRAAELLYTEPWISPDDAVELGLARRVCEPDRLLPETRELAARIGALPLGPLMATKRLLVAGRVDAIRAARERELEAFGPLVEALLADGR
ncbi:MAG: enoyl-CoA hydratase-related protein [Acidimicrobiia bacterium]|nr:enoyl-CoA hydratase-related protein [Acidimicrobiia bacterium]